MTFFGIISPTGCGRPRGQRAEGACCPETSGHLKRRFLETSGQIINRGDHIIMQLNRRTYSPVLRHADIPAVTTVPWWGNRQLHFKYT